MKKNKTKKIKYILITLLLLSSNINKSYAECTKEEINHFKEIEDKTIAFSKYDDTSKSVALFVKEPNSDSIPYRILIDIDDESICSNDNDYIKCINLSESEYHVKILGNNGTCTDELKSITVKMSKINNYYSDPLCSGIEEFVLCQPTYDKEIDYETFKSRVETYKKDKNNKSKDKEVQSDNNNSLTEYINNNLFQIIVISIFIILMIITIILTANSIKKSRRLE